MMSETRKTTLMLNIEFLSDRFLKIFSVPLCLPTFHGLNVTEIRRNKGRVTLHDKRRRRGTGEANLTGTKRVGP